MKCILVASLLVCLGLAASAEPIMDREGHYYEHRPRLGHFAVEPFTELYKTYAAAFVFPNVEGRDADNYRNYLPSGEECVVFFRQFRIDEYELRDLDDMVVLDACLGYLYTSTYHKADKEFSVNVRNNLDELIADPKLKELFESTKVNEYSEPAKDCVGDLLFDVIKAKKQFGDVVCNHHWLEIFLSFAQCHKTLPEEAKENDSYAKIIYKLVKERGNACFHEEISILNREVRELYRADKTRRLFNSLHLTSISGQAHKRMIPQSIVKLLTVIQGTKKEINLRECLNVARGVSLGNPAFKETLLRHLSEAATEAIHPKKDSKSTRADPTGAERYLAFVDGLCSTFRPSDNDKIFDFTTPFILMIRLTQHPEVFDISTKYLVDHVIKHSYETTPLYAAVANCNILTFTEAVFERQAANGPLKYKVVFQSNIDNMLVWPDAGGY